MIKMFLFLFISTTCFANVSTSDYLELTSALSSLYGKKIEEKGGQLKFNLTESNHGANAYAVKGENNLWEIVVLFGLLEIKEQTKASLGVILCHEVGHFLAGEPYVVGIQLTPAVRSRAPKKMSCEGQADYFATSECLKNLSSLVPDLFLNNIGILNPLVSSECEKSFSNDREIKICQETLIASYQTTLIYQKIMEKVNVPASFFSKMDNDRSDRTLRNVGEYPTLDCRYETFIRGTLCSSLDGTVCNDMKWSRPACWFMDN